MLAEEDNAQVQGGQGQQVDQAANDDDMSTDDEEHIPTKKRMSVEPQPNGNVKKYRALHLPKMVEAVYASQCRREGCTGKTFVKCIKCHMFL